MKKSLFYLFVFILCFGFVQSSHAFKEGRDGDLFENPLTSYAQKKNKEKLERAVGERRRNYFRKKSRDNKVYKNWKNQFQTHRRSKANAGLNERSTRMKRTGKLRTRSFDRLRPMSSKSPERSTAKQTFRARAIDYYIRGGEAGSEAMRSGVTRSTEHQVSRRKIVSRRARIGRSERSIRNKQRNLSSWKSAKSNIQPKFKRRPSYQKFGHPYMAPVME